MSSTDRRRWVTLLAALIVLSTTACTANPRTVPAPATRMSSLATATSTPVLPTQAPPSAMAPTATSTLAIPGTAIPTPAPAITLKKGDFYFSVRGKPGFVFLRNLAGTDPSHYERTLDLIRTGGNKLVRIQLDSMGAGYNQSGELDESWMKNWERVLDYAAAAGIQVLPVFAGWFDWNDGNPDYGYSTWKSNPFNLANGGPARTPAELFQPVSSTQRLWMQWIKTVVGRWQGRNNIAAWEIFSEVNISSGVTESLGVKFVEKAASVIRDADSHRRPITASLADIGEWPSFYQSEAVDFINLHPYPPSGQLDASIIQNVPRYRNKYNKPVLIGESGLSALPPHNVNSTLTTATQARIGVKHAIWAAVVSGTMNGRALYWEDGFAIFFPLLDWPFVEKYSDAESAAARFVDRQDFAGLKPLTATYSAKIIGAAIGDEKTVIGWFRDAGCEPPDWHLQPSVSKQTVTLTVPGSASDWRVDFYDTNTGSTLINSITATRNANQITLALPDFTDDIAFKMQAQSIARFTPSASRPTAVPPPDTRTPTTPPARTTDPVAGKWAGTITGQGTGFSAWVDLSIRPGCKIGSACGSVAVPQLPCSGDIVLSEVNGDDFIFIERNMTGAPTCTSGGYEYLRVLADGTLSFNYKATNGGVVIASSGILKRQ